MHQQQIDQMVANQLKAINEAAKPVNPTVTYTGYAYAPKWAGLKPFLWDLAISSGLDFKIIDQDKGWIRETLYFEVKGSPDKVDKFMKIAQETVEDRNI